MAVSEQTPYIEYTANGSTASFALGFTCKEKGHLIVKLNDVEASPNLWSLSDGIVVFNAAPSNGTKILIQRKTPNRRTTNYQNYNNSFNPAALNEDLDTIWRRIQEEDVARYFLNQLISKNYLDLLGNDQQVRSELLGQIIAQGISQRQIEDYAHNLMRNISSISAGKGWVSGLVEMTRGGTLDEFVDSNIEKSLLDFIPIQHHQSIKNYEYTVDCHAYIQAAIDWATSNNRGVYAPAGGYLIDGGDMSVRLVNNWGLDRNLIVRGAGLGLTIFKEAPGKTNRVGRFCKMFYLYYGVSSFVGNFGHIKFSGITFDKNGSSNINDSTLYNYEQAHILSGAGSGTVNIKSIQFDDIELRDKIGGGINFSSSPNVKIGKVTCNNIISEYHPKVTGVGDGTFGQRGCLEFGTSIEVLDINNPKAIYAQIEPTIPSSATNQRSCNVNGGSIRTLEWTDKGGYSYANIVNCVARNKFLTRGVHVNATNCTLKVPEIFAGGIIKINGGTILLNYDPATNSVSPCSHGQVTGYTEYSEMWLSNLDVRIDSDDPALLPTGYGLSAPTVGLIGSFKRILNNVKLDSRLESGVNAYGNGDWKIINSDLQGRSIQVGVGGTGSVRGGYVELINNNYQGSGVKVHLFRNNTLWKLKIIGEYTLDNFWGVTGTGDITSTIDQLPILTASSQPANTTFSPPGQIVKNSAFNGSGVKEWVKVGAGTSAYQKYIYNITGIVAYSGEVLPANTRGAEYTITLDGAVLGDAVQVTLDKNLNGGVVEAYVSAANTVKARIYNPTAASVTIAAGTLKAKLT